MPLLRRNENQEKWICKSSSSSINFYFSTSVKYFISIRVELKHTHTDYVFVGRNVTNHDSIGRSCDGRDDLTLVLNRSYNTQQVLRSVYILSSIVSRISCTTIHEILSLCYAFSFFFYYSREKNAILESTTYLFKYTRLNIYKRAF